jgi:hypothetical protein
VHAPLEAADGTEPGWHEPRAFAEQEVVFAPPEQSTGSAPDDDPPLPLPELEPLEDPDEEPDDEPLEDPEEDPDDEPLEDPDDEPLEEPLEDPDDEPLEEPDDEPLEAPLEEPDDEPLEEPLLPPLPVPLLLPLPLALPSSTTIPPSELTPTSVNSTSLPAAQAARTLAAAMPTKPTGRSQDTFMSHLHHCTQEGGRRPDSLARAYSPLNGMRHAQTPAALSIETRAMRNQWHRKHTVHRSARTIVRNRERP